MNTEQICDAEATKETHVCPWQIVRLFDNFLRPLIHNPRKLFGPYVQPGMKVLDIGCGRGFASLGLARLVGEGGLVISADLQTEMLDMVRKRATKVGLSNRIRTHRCNADCIGVREELDFAVAFFMAHEVPDVRAFLTELFTLLKPGGLLYITEPKIHVNRRDFEHTVKLAQSIGLTISGEPDVWFGRTVLFVKSTESDKDDMRDIGAFPACN